MVYKMLHGRHCVRLQQQFSLYLQWITN